MTKPPVHPSARRSSAEKSIDAPSRHRLPVLLRRAWYGLNQTFRRRIVSLGITPDQFTVMRNVLENEGLTQGELAALMASDPNTVAALLERMESAGLVDRRSCERDRRAKRLKLTARGRNTYHEARRIAIKLQSHLLDTLPKDQRETFLENLFKVSEACQKAARSREPGS